MNYNVHVNFKLVAPPQVKFFFFIGSVELKNKCTAQSCELSFIWAKNEDCSLGDSASGNSERLLQRGGGWGQAVIYVILMNRAYL